MIRDPTLLHSCCCEPSFTGLPSLHVFHCGMNTNDFTESMNRDPTLLHSCCCKPSFTGLPPLHVFHCGMDINDYTESMNRDPTLLHSCCFEPTSCFVCRSYSCKLKSSCLVFSSFFTADPLLCIAQYLPQLAFEQEPDYSYLRR